MRLRMVYGLLTSLLLSGCDNNDVAESTADAEQAAHNAELQHLLAQVTGNLVFVEGGEFLMGDFGGEYGRTRGQIDGNEDSKPLHKVTLSSYSIGKFKTTNLEYQRYLKLNKLPLKESDIPLTQELMEALNTLPNTPAHMDWYDAEQYCAWLGKVSGLPFALPTEAQWEYAARSRGQFVVAGTNSGVLEMDGIQRGINISGSLDRKEFARENGLRAGMFTALPVDRYPPNPLGLYDMAGNGLDWVKDWYDPDYYKNSPSVDPQGPATPVFKKLERIRDTEGKYQKVLRGAALSGPMYGSTVTRYQSAPDTRTSFVTTVRCAVNSPQPVK